MIANHATLLRILPSLIAFFLMAGLVFHGVRHRNIPGALPFIITNVFSALWMAGSVMENAVPDIATKIFWVKFEAIWQLPAATTMTCFVLEYAWPGRWLTRRNILLLSIAPIIVAGFIVTNDFHFLFWQGFQTDTVITPLLGLVGWTAIAYSFILVGLNLGVFTWLFIHSPQHRVPVAIMMGGHIVFRSLFMLEKAGAIRPYWVVDEIGLAFIVSMYSIALYGFKIFDPVPFAHRNVIQQMQDGMFVLDLEERLVSMNPAAERITNLSIKQVRKQNVAMVLPRTPDLNSLLSGVGIENKLLEISPGNGGNPHLFEVEISPLLDFRSLPVGKLILLHDVTEQHHAQTLIVEQQRSLATLQERERLAHELHDELAQELALINLQSQLVTTLLEQGQLGQATAQLEILAKAARAAHVDVRDEISTLSNHVAGNKTFLEALNSLVKTFEKTFGIKTELVCEGMDPTMVFTPVVEVQLMRIIQEAFTNIRKHAKASQVIVTITNSGGRCKLSVIDNGVGFSLDTPPSSRQTFGLGIMSKRASEINGWVDYESAPGEGTRITVTFPIKSSEASFTEVPSQVV